MNDQTPQPHEIAPTSRAKAARRARERARRSARRRGALFAGGAAALAGLAVFNHWRARRAEEAHPPTGRFLGVDGVQVHYAEWGEGDPVVLLHGNGTLVQDWEISGLAPALAREHRVIAFDRPGYGYTDRPRDRLWTARAQADLIAKAMDRLGIANAVVLGHSWGALVAAALGLDHPEKAAGLVLLSGYYFPTARLDALAFAPPAIPVLGDAMRHTVSPLLGIPMAPKLIQKVFEPRPVPRRFRERFPLELALRPVQLKGEAEDSGLMIPSAASLRNRYGELRQPVAVLTGDSDRIVTPEHHSMRLDRVLPDSELTVLEGLGHMIHYDAIGPIAAAVDRVSRRSPRRRASRPAGSAPQRVAM